MKRLGKLSNYHGNTRQCRSVIVKSRDVYMLRVQHFPVRPNGSW